MLKQAIWFPAIVIGIVAAIFTGTGLHLGKKISSGSHLSSYAEFAGGLILLTIGFKILHAHGSL
jgi:putative Mn2+ efflux pump MntP